jgi:hypothetical protein
MAPLYPKLWREEGVFAASSHHGIADRGRREGAAAVAMQLHMGTYSTPST